MSARGRGTLGGIAVLVGLCTLPAYGNQDTLDEAVVHKLTPIDTVVTKQDLTTFLFPNSTTVELVDKLQKLVTSNNDFGLRFRTIRALAHVCDTQTNVCRDAILAMLDYVDPNDAGRPGQRALRLRAAIEALGALPPGHPEDVTRLVAFLSDSSRDLRVAAARALRDLCDPAAIVPLRRRLTDEYGNPVERVKQVQLAIEDALAVLARAPQCGP